MPNPTQHSDTLETSQETTPLVHKHTELEKFYILNGRLMVVLVIFTGLAAYDLMKGLFNFWIVFQFSVGIFLTIYWQDQKRRVKRNQPILNTLKTRLWQLILARLYYSYLLGYLGFYGIYLLFSDFSWGSLGFVLFAIMFSLTFSQNARNRINALYNLAIFGAEDTAFEHLLRTVQLNSTKKSNQQTNQ